MRYLVAYLVALLVMLPFDALWLGIVAADFYSGAIGHLMAAQPRLGVAAVFYLLYLAGVVIFAVAPALQARSARRAIALGALFGFFTYMTYELTNLATLRDWPLRVVIVDLIWGVFLSAAAAAAGYQAAVRASR